MKFEQIGSGWVRKSKKSNLEYIGLTVLKEKLERVHQEDYSKLCLFRNQYKKNQNDPDYQLCAPVQDEPSTGTTVPGTTPVGTPTGVMGLFKSEESGGPGPLPWEEKLES